jgi:hypothetical protein
MLAIAIFTRVPSLQTMAKVVRRRSEKLNVRFDHTDLDDKSFAPQEDN